MAVAPDGSWLASGGSSSTVRIWDAASGRERATLEGHTGPGKCGDGGPRRQLGGLRWCPQTVRIWDAATGREEAVLEGHTMAVNALAVAPDGSWLASGSSDQRVCVWRAVSWLGGCTREATPGLSRADSSAGRQAGWRRPRDQTVRIWDVTARRASDRKGPHHAHGGLAVAPDGSWMASGGE